jgi:PAS domain S-box-containing protein
MALSELVRGLHEHRHPRDFHGGEGMTSDGQALSEQARVRGGARPALLLALFSLAALGLAAVGLALSPSSPGTFAVFWPASGLCLGALLLTPRRAWAAILAAAAIPMAAFTAAVGLPPLVVASFALGKVVEALVAAALTERLCGGRPQPWRVAHLTALVVAGPLLAAAFAALPTALALHALAASPLADGWCRNWMGSALGMLVITPAVLAWADRETPLLPGHRAALEAAAIVATTAIGVAVVFFVPQGLLHLDGALLVPAMLWAAFRFGPRGAATTALAVVLSALAATVTGHGPFAAQASSPGDALLSAQLFSAVTVLAVLAVSTVVESRRLAAAALVRSQLDLLLVRIATDAATDFIVCVEPDGTVVYANDAYCAAVGRTRAEVLGAPIWSGWWCAGPDEWAAHWQEVERRGTLTVEKLAALPGDEALPVEIRSSPVPFEGRSICVSAARGLRERRQVEAALRMASVGTLAAGMAHEINNPLAYVLSNLEWVTAQLQQGRTAVAPAGPRQEESAAALRDRVAAVLPVLGEISEGGERIRSIVRDLRLFSRSSERDGVAASSCDLVRTVRAAVSLASVEIRHRARLVLALEDGLPRVAGDEHRLGQVFLNLLVNAAQAIPERRVEEHLIRVGARPGGTGEVLVEVEDTGAGMPASTLAHVFEPFFTTKPVGTGTGLGLSICHGIVAELGGRMEVSSRPGAGTLFRVRLPVAPPPGERPALVEAPPVLATAPRGRILLIDDEARVAAAAARLLSDHQVRTATSAAEALKLCAAERFDLVLCDLLMPEMTGMDFQRRLRDDQPELAARIIFVTGGADTAEASAFLASTPNTHLDKPFDAERLRAEVARTLGGVPRRARALG